jgi:hypothetical protein
MQYTWLIWTLIFLLLWLIIFIFKKPFRKEMLKMSLWTMPFGLTEPLFYPEYWHPPTLFKLAEHTGFDIESLIFSFAIGGVASLLYKIVYKMENKFIQPTERNLQKHKLHFYSLLTPGIVFLLLALLTNLNHIYCGIIAFFCRPDLKIKIWVSGILFLFLYFIYFKLLIAAYPGYVAAVWNFTNISDILVVGIPLEELLFGFTFGMFWSSLYEHIFWYRVIHKSSQLHST